tara:strand:+ start:378 stop:884 length:507 start_codon:yes stop_codon:yes gene_type:complete
MIDKLRQNIPLVLGGITLLGAIGSGINEMGRVVDTLTGIDDRMSEIEIRFDELRDETMVSNDIAIIFEKINQLEQESWESGYLEDRVLLLEESYGDLQTKYYDLEYDIEYLKERIIYLESDMNQDQGGVEDYELQELKDRLLILENEWYNNKWKFEDFDNRIQWLESR